MASRKTILNKYELKRRLGKGAYGEVMLAQDKQGNQFAIKMLSLNNFKGENQYLLDYLKSQIDCLKKINSPYVMKLYDTQQDQNFKYMICEYCDGGDIISVQAKQPQRVFTLEKASSILTYVIKGLQQLHNSGFIHRDIKAENILMKTETGKEVKEVYKLSDFGFTKNIKDISFTILGTGAYMSPEIYDESQYGFEVDMWAFGILFYFMLNMEFPFKPNQFPNTKKKCEELRRLSQNFSYKAFVEKSRKKNLHNCTEDIEDLFKKMLNPNPHQRINFHEIRSHPIFKKYFPQNDINQVSKILYKFRETKIKNNNQVLSSIKIKTQNAGEIFSAIHDSDQNFEQQRRTIEKEKQKILFLQQSLIQIQKNAELPFLQETTLTYNIRKYIIISIKKFIQLLSQDNLSRQFSNLKWKSYCKTQAFLKTKQEMEKIATKLQFEMQKISNDCQQNLELIKIRNQDFENGFSKKIASDQFQGAFKKSYRRSTVQCYEFILKRLKKQNKKGTLFNFHLALITIFHAYNKIFEDTKALKHIFQNCLTEAGKDIESVGFLQLKAIMSKLTVGQLNYISKSIIETYFSK